MAPGRYVGVQLFIRLNVWWEPRCKWVDVCSSQGARGGPFPVAVLAFLRSSSGFRPAKRVINFDQVDGVSFIESLIMISPGLVESVKEFELLARFLTSLD